MTKRDWTDDLNHRCLGCSPIVALTTTIYVLFTKTIRPETSLQLVCGTNIAHSGLEKKTLAISINRAAASSKHIRESHLGYKQEL